MMPTAQYKTSECDIRPPEKHLIHPDSMDSNETGILISTAPSDLTWNIFNLDLPGELLEQYLKLLLLSTYLSSIPLYILTMNQL